MGKYEEKELKKLEEIAIEITKEENEYLKKKRIQLIVMYIIAVVLIIVFYFSTKITNETIKLIFGIFSVLPSLTLICIAYLQREKYDFLYRKEVVSKFIKKVDNLDFNENFNYKVNYEREYRNLKLDNIEFDETKWSSYISGDITQNCFIEMFNLTTYKYRYSIRSKIKEPIFNGIYIVLNVNKELPYTKILRNNKDLFINNGLNIGDRDFKKYFIVETINIDKTNNILTPNLICFLSEFRKKYKINFEMVLKDNICIRVFIKKLFKPSLFSKNILKKSIYDYYIIRKLILGIDENIN